MSTEQILLFLDIQGVLSLPHTTAYRNDPMAPAGAIAGAQDFIATVDGAEWIEPMWISSLGRQSLIWNDWAKTQRWAIAYPLPDHQIDAAKASFPSAATDGKCLAARWCSRRWLHRIVWIEDGFSAVARAWAKENPKVKLISTCPIDARVPHDEVGLASWNLPTIQDALRLN